jgi:hypothetical protein
MMISIIQHLPIWAAYIIGYLRFDDKATG